MIDPEGIASRYARRLSRREYLSPGPNFVWHLDGYDNLKPFGFSIHACIDGFSRNLMWSEVGTTNKNPKVTAHYFLNTVEKYRCLPTIVRSDKGTENVLIESLQICLRREHNDKFAEQYDAVDYRKGINEASIRELKETLTRYNEVERTQRNVEEPTTLELALNLYINLVNANEKTSKGLLIQEGYSIFVVNGVLPPCKAEEIFLKYPIVMKPKADQPKASTEEARFPSKDVRWHRLNYLNRMNSRGSTSKGSTKLNI
ncbi:hypothetical protein TSAR_010993 [Trichomalopsis sarcophagae]|uniref:Integrase core domain-containing protein n=1 Tax=Trichomalopsis sarcophagae TaxID=543379 RepID=A0A232EIK1_9HYME|nr:hypothetical protein TSAR_010993 [Trichomalopsis sarcophagae]